MTGSVVCCKQMTAYEMRISDWSSDVCSSDLHDMLHRLLANPLHRGQRIEDHAFVVIAGELRLRTIDVRREYATVHPLRFLPEDVQDGKRVVQGKSVAVRVDHGGRRRSKKKLNHNKNDNMTIGANMGSN